MVKRKRSVESDGLSAAPDSSAANPHASESSVSTLQLSTPRLTASNLNRLQCAVKPATSSPCPSDSTGSAAATSDSTLDYGLMATQLEILNIHIRERKKITPPHGVQELLDEITKPFIASPKSKKTAQDIAEASERTRDWRETTALDVLEEFFGYRPELPLESNTDAIFRDREQLWKTDLIPIPRPTDIAARVATNEALEQLGLPPAPKPDVLYAYNATAFDQNLAKILHGNKFCSPAASDHVGLMPFLITEWKSEKSGGNMYKANVQAARDAAVAINSSVRFHQSMTDDDQAQPSAEQSAVATLCVDSHTFELRLHWRQEENTECGQEVSWETKILADGMLRQEEQVAKARMYLRRIFDWAKGERLERIRQVLQQRLDRGVELARNAKGKEPHLPTPSPSTIRNAKKQKMMDEM